MLRKTLAGVVFCISIFILLFRFPVALADGYADYCVARALVQQKSESSNRKISVPCRGPMTFYAQVNPFWAEMRYEARGSSSYRRFGEGGCCPTSAAIAIANLVEPRKLGAIRPYAATGFGGFGISTGIMNPLNMSGRDGVYRMERAQDYYDYLPLVFGQFAAGNNLKKSVWRASPRQWQVSTGGTGPGFIPLLCDIYGLTYTQAPGKMNMDWVEAVRNGAVAVALANSQWQPFSTGDGHYVCIVGCDDTYLYIFDPQDKIGQDYVRNRKNALDIMEPGLVRVKWEDYRFLYFGMVHILSTPEIDARCASDHENAVPLD